MSTVYFRRPYVPRDLRIQDRWLPWALRGKKKVPLGTDGRACDPRDSANWRNIDDATAPYFREERGVSGVGFALDGSGSVVLDLDHSVDDRGRLAPEARQWVDQLGSYTELSQSGRGLHVVIARDGLDGNRRQRGLELLASGFVTVTGHPLVNVPISDGGAVFEALLRRLPPKPALLHPASVAPTVAPSRDEVAAVLARAMPNAGFRRLWNGDWSDYESRSEADAALCMHVARNGGDAGTIIELLRNSGLRRSKLDRDDYVTRQAHFALCTADIRIPRWQGFTVPPANGAEQEAVERIRMHAILARDASLLERVASEIAARQERGEQGIDGFFRVSPEGLSGDFKPRPGLLPPVRIMTRRGCLKALKRLASAGVIDVRQEEGWIVWGGGSRRRRGKVTCVRVDGLGMARILHGFADRLDEEPVRHPTSPVYVLGTPFHNDESGAAA